MLNKDYTARMLNLEEVIVTNAEIYDGELHISLELPVKEHHCPACGTLTTYIHDYRNQTIKDIPFGRTTLLHLRKRRYICKTCGKKFYENNPFLGRYCRATKRMVAAVISAFSKIRSCAEIASQFNISCTTAFRYFDQVGYGMSELPEVLSIDEFKGNADKEKYQCILTDPQNKKVLDILPNRFESHLIRYFKQYSERNKVKYFVTDMNPHFKSVAKTCFPDAVIIADRYHIIRQVVWAMENVRKREQKQLSPEFRKYFKRSKSLLNKSIEKLEDDEKNSLALMFEISPRLKEAYKLKNYFFLVMHSNPDKAGKLLADWLLLAESKELEEFKACITAYHNWSEEIQNAIRYQWSNGFTEGCNNKTKVLKRVCFGVRNFSRFRNRILHCAN